VNDLHFNLSMPRAALTAALACTAPSVGQTPTPLEWPEPFIAADIRLSSVGDHININGIPARIYRYTTERRPDEVVRYFRDHVERDFGRVEPATALPGQTAVGGRVGDFWVTLQIQEQMGETVGTWSAIPQFVPGIRQTVQRPAGFPSSAKLIQQVDSFDDDKRSQVVIGMDPGPVDGVAGRLEGELLDQGFVKQTTPQTNWPTPSVYAAVFRKPREELLVTLNQELTGTSVMINRISALEELK
jgi:hypothetical protein